ncbi:MAG: threonylcarbamoyl-AMP synthase [Nitrosarchaeum sp.]|nr:threonylcarbamoyl-AMP synthase [Nitrosarchaeum sp.]PHY08473.1 MAG: threonylcarbamoyl-AMP synthase [Nitrosarchaeum sp.]
MKIKCDKIGIAKASKIIKNGGVVVFPTDTVYGIGCDPYNKDAIKRIYKIKSRKSSKSLPILVFSKDIAMSIVEFDKNSEKIADEFWPGPLTLILKLKDRNLESLSVNGKIAIRVPKHSSTLKLLKECNFLIGTSANISGTGSFTNPAECYQNIQDFDLFLDGKTISSDGESTIIEFEEDKLKIHREGILKERDIVKIL